MPPEEKGFNFFEWLPFPLMVAQGLSGAYSAQMAIQSGHMAELESMRRAQLLDRDKKNVSIELNRQRKQIIEDYDRHVDPRMLVQGAGAGIDVKSGGMREIQREGELNKRRMLSDAAYGSHLQIEKLRNQQESIIRKGKAAMAGAKTEAYSTYFQTGIGLAKTGMESFGSREGRYGQ